MPRKIVETLEEQLDRVKREKMELLGNIAETRKELDMIGDHYDYLVKRLKGLDIRLGEINEALKKVPRDQQGEIQ